MRKQHLLWFLGIVVALSMVLAVSCGADDEKDDPDGTPAADGPTATQGAAEAVPGVTDTEIVLGTHQPLSGSPAAVYSQIVKVTQAYFDYINETEGGVFGRKITLKIEDDQYTPSLTVEVVKKLVEQDEIFALLNGLGTATHMSVVDYLQERGVPDMFMSTGAVEWVKDPSARPLVFGTIANYVAEGLVLGTYISENFEGKKVGFIGQNDDFGDDGLVGIQLGIGDAVEMIEPLTYEAVDPDINAQIDQLKDSGADVVVLFALPSHIPTAIKHARQDLNWDVPFVITGVSANELTIALAGEGVMEGTVSQVALRQAYETDLEAIQKHIEVLAFADDITEPSFLTLYGQTVGELMVEALTVAGEDLTRQGLVEAAESFTDFQCSVCLFAGTMSATDHDPTQATQLAKVENDVWTPFGAAYSWEGVSVADLSPDTLEVITSPYE